ncbi:zf-HC2 domain-containing protein [bacterium]|nr:zf-HC2 domain-containing protein [bacterium]
MKCDKRQQKISRYVLQILSPKEMSELEAHLSRCPACWGQLEQEKAIQNAINGMGSVSAPDGFNQAVWRKINTPVYTPELKNRFKWLPVTAGAMALATAVFAVVAYRVFISPQVRPVESKTVVSLEKGTVQSADAVFCEGVAAKTIVGEKIEKKIKITKQFLPKEDVKIEVTAAEQIRIDSSTVVLTPGVPVAGSFVRGPAKDARTDQTGKPAFQRPEKLSHQPAGSIPASEPIRRSAASSGTPQIADSATLVSAIRHVRIYNNKIHSNRGEKVRLEFTMVLPGRVSAGVFSKEGRLVKDLMDRQLASGEQHLEWDGTDRHGQKSASGIYILVLSGDIETRRFKLVVVK